jgi:hypothetical protein
MSIAQTTGGYRKVSVLGDGGAHMHTASTCNGVAQARILKIDRKRENVAFRRGCYGISNARKHLMPSNHGKYSLICHLFENDVDNVPSHASTGHFTILLVVVHSTANFCKFLVHSQLLR